jgi:hypothetical protein
MSEEVTNSNKFSNQTAACKEKHKKIIDFMQKVLERKIVQHFMVLRSTRMKLKFPGISKSHLEIECDRDNNRST